MKKLLAFLQLARPANIVTAVADILLGFALSGAVVQFNWNAIEITNTTALFWLILATIGLYGGGVVMNDVFDADLDREERPERPIPSGRVSLKAATIFGFLLLVGGIVAAGMVAHRSLIIAALTAIAALLYDAYGKHHSFLGPLNMGLCRALNLLLGASVLPIPPFLFLLALLPIIYIAGITTISRGEVSGNNKRELQIGLGLYLIVIFTLLWLGFQSKSNFLSQIPFILLFAGMILVPLFKAIQNPEPQYIGKAVKMGVIALILFDAALATAFAGVFYGLAIVLLLPLSIGLARLFAVT